MDDEVGNVITHLGKETPLSQTGRGAEGDIESKLSELLQLLRQK
jgi:hypothetical protein